MPISLFNIGWRYLLRHPRQTALMILGITLGIAVVVSIDLANVSAMRAFNLSTETVAGRATHQIVGGADGLDETVYTQLRRQGILQAAAPIIAEYISSPQLGDQPLQLLGIDPFADAPFRSYLTGASGPPLDELTAFFTQPGALLISADVASRYRLAVGQRITVQAAGYTRSAFIAGLLRPSDGLSRRALDELVLADISTAQELTGRIGKLDRIDLILPENDTGWLEQISALLPRDARIMPVEARAGAVAQMTAAFQTNLTALSLLALLVGLFLIYNTMTFSVVQRRPLFGTLRCLGVTRREVAALVIGEALVVGVLGAILGLALGVVMGQGAVQMVTRTINDLYFVVTVRGVAIPAVSLVKGAVVGILATVLTAALPAWEAASVTPHAALSRSGLEAKARQAVMGVAVGGLAVLGLGAGTLILTRSLVVSLAGTLAVMVGFTMLTPLATVLLMGGAAPMAGRLWGALGRMAPRNVINSLSRTSIAVAALMVAVAVTIGVSLMIGSFRSTVIAWLAQTLQGDIYMSAPLIASTQPSAPIDPAVLRTVKDWPGVARVDSVRSVMVDSPNGPVHVYAFDNPDFAKEHLFLSADGLPEQIQAMLSQGAVIVTEPFATLVNLPKHGGAVTVYTDNGLHTFPVVGICYDYASSQGTVFIPMQTYRQFWQDDAVTAISLRLAKGVPADAVTRELQDALDPIQHMVIRPNQVLRNEVLAIFDRTFAITSALQLLATMVAFIGVLSALLSLQLDKQRELGILRAVGLTARQLWRMVMLETGLMGAVAGLLAMPAGYVLALILIYVINRRSFGWTLQMHVGVEPFVQALAVAVVAALLAGIYPAGRMSKMITAEALREE